MIEEGHRENHEGQCYSPNKVRIPTERKRCADRHARFGNELLRGLVEANQRTIAVAWPRVDGQHVFHSGYERAVGLRRDDPVLAAMGLKSVFFERAPDRAVAGTIDNAEFYHLVLQQPQ